MSPQFVHNLKSLAHRCAEMIRAFGNIGLINIVWTHTHSEQGAHKFEHHIRIIVHAFHEHRLIPDRTAGIRKHCARLFSFGSTFPGMIEVCIYVNRMIFFQHIDQFRGDALRQDARHFCSETNDLNMRDFAQPFEDFLEHIIGQHERVSPRQDDITDFRMRPDIIETVLYELHTDFIGIPDLPFPRTETTIHRTLTCRQKQDAIRVTVRYTRDGTVCIFIKRIFRKVIFLKLLLVRNTLKPDRITGITNQAQVIRVNTNVKQSIEPFGYFWIEAESVHNVLCAVYAFTQQLLPQFHYTSLRYFPNMIRSSPTL